MKNSICIICLWIFCNNALAQDIKFVANGVDTAFYVAASHESTIILSDSNDCSALFTQSVPIKKISPFAYKVELSASNLISLEIPNSRVFPAYYDESERLRYLCSEIIVKFHPWVTLTQIEQLENTFNLTLKESNTHYAVYNCDDPFLACQDTYASGLVMMSEPNFYFQLELASHIPNDPYFEKQFYLRNTGQLLNDEQNGVSGNDIKITEAWELTTGHKSTRVMIIDANGLEFGHPDLPEYKIDRVDLFISDLNYVQGNTNTGHAQACAGILAAEMDNDEGISGIIPRCTLTPASILFDGWGTFVDLTSIFWTIYDLPENKLPEVISCSMVAVDSHLLKVAVDSLATRNVVVCFAAGNIAQHSAIPPCDGPDTYTIVADSPNVLIVGACTAQGNAADYSLFGPWVDLAAPSATDITCGGGLTCAYQSNIPGQLPNVWTTDVTGVSGYNGSYNTAISTHNCTPFEQSILPSENLNYTGRFWGTSAATPQVAGVVGLMRAANSCLSYEDAITIIKETADKIGVGVDGIAYNYDMSTTPPGHSVELGHGRLDAYEAVSQALAYGGFDFEIEITDHICGSNDEGAIDIVFPSANASEYTLFLEWPAFMNFEELPSVQISGTENILVPNQGNRPYLLHVVKNSSGCTSTRQFWIYKEDTFELTIGDVQNNCFPATVCAEVAGGTEPFSYYWNGELGPNCLEYASSFNADLLVKDSLGCSQSMSIPLSASSTWNFDSEIDFSTECLFVPGSTVLFSNYTNIEDVNFLWNFGDGTFSYDQFATHTYSESGNFNVSLSLSSGTCNPIVLSQTVSIGNFDNIEPIIITADAQTNSWNNNTQSFGQNIKFGNGSPVTVTIHDAVFILGPGVEIIISENASVTFDRCTFTSCTNWEGFRVRSNSQTTSTSGILRMDVTNIQSATNLSVVKNARIGIEVRDERTNANSVSTAILQGGRIFCGRTQFVNCKQAFNANNANFKGSYFKLCRFVVDDEIELHFPDISQAPGYNEMANQCKHFRSIGYNYYGCSWTNTMSTNIDNWTNRGKAVSAAASNLTITHFTANNSPTPIIGTIEGFDVGFQQSSKGGRVILSYQKFQQNHIAAYFLGGFSHRVFKNDFVIGRNTDVQALDEDEEYGTFPGNSNNLGINMTTSYEGLVVRNSDLMEIAENTFTGVLETDELDNDGDNNDGVASNYPRVGIRIRATNTEDMVVRKNTLSKLNYANLANGDNAGGTGTSGLRYICNVNNGNLQDFTNTDFVGIQGSATIGTVQQEPIGTYPSNIQLEIWPTGNILSTDPNENEVTYIHFRNEGVGVTYWHLEQLGGGNQTPEDFVGLGLVDMSLQHACPNKYTSVISVPNAPSVINNLVSAGVISKAEADLYLYIYLLLLDDGNTQALQQQVENTWGNQLWATRAQLMNISPYVTSTVMTSVLNNTQVYPHAIAFELLMANPDLMKDPYLVSLLSSKSDPMPQYLVDLLLTYAADGSSRSIMEKELASKRIGHISKVSEALWAMMEYYEDDTFLENDFESVIGGIGTLNAEIAAVETLLNKGDMNGANTRANNISTLIKFGPGEIHEYESYMEWVTLRTDMMSNNRDWNTLSESDFSQLKRFLDSFDTYAAAQAMEVLNTYTGTDYFIPPAYGENGIIKRKQTASTDISEQFIEVYPNPADFIVTIRLKEDLPTSDMCNLVVTDVMGREVLSQQVNPSQQQITMNTEKWVVGLYTFKFIIPNTPIEINGKFEVVH